MQGKASGRIGASPKHGHTITNKRENTGAGRRQSRHNQSVLAVQLVAYLKAQRGCQGSQSVAAQV